MGTYRMASEFIVSNKEGSVTTHELGTPVHAVREDGTTVCGATVAHVIAHSNHSGADEAVKCTECAADAK